MNNEITLSGSDNIEVDEIDLVEGGKFYIGGEVIPMRVLATNSDGQLYYSQNDFLESTIFNENHTQEIDCEISRINVIGDLNVNKNNPIQVSGTKPINTFLGINNDNEFGYYPANFTPAKIQFTNSLDEIVSKVECFGDTGIVCDGWVKFHTLTPFYLHDEPLGLPNQVLAIGSNGLMKWSFVEKPNIPTTSNLDINSLIVEGFVPGLASYGVVIKTGLRVDGLASFKGTLGVVVDNDLLVQGDIKVMKNLDCRASIQLTSNLYMTSASNISIGGDTGGINDVIGKDANNNLKWIHIGAEGFTSGLNIDGAKLDLGIIATNHDLIDLNNIKMNDAEPRFFVGANFGAGVSPAVLGSRANSGLLEWMNLTGASHTNPIFRAGVNINTADMLDGQISVDYFPVFGGIHLNGSGAGYSGAVLELNSVIGIRQGKIQGSPIDDVNTTPITEWVEPIVNVFWATTGSGLRINLNTIINARSATDIVVANTATTEDITNEFHFLTSGNAWNGRRFLKQHITFPVGVISPLRGVVPKTLIRVSGSDSILVGSLNCMVGQLANHATTLCIELTPDMNVSGFYVGLGTDYESLPASHIDIQLIYSGVVAPNGKNIIYCNATLNARFGSIQDSHSWNALYYG